MLSDHLKKIPSENGAVQHEHSATIDLLYGAAWAPALLAALEQSTHHIEALLYMATPLKSKNAETIGGIADAMLAAPSRGIACRAILPTWGENDPLRNINAVFIAAATAAGWKIRRTNKNRLQHAKLYIFDRASLLIGSHNLTSTAVTQNVELSIMIESKLQAARAAALFDKIWAEAT